MSTPNPFLYVAEKYIGAGVSVLPVAMGSKAFKSSYLLPGWKDLQSRLMAPNEIAHYKASPSNIAVVLGRVSNICALDIDNLTPKEVEAVFSIVPQSPIRKIGAKGSTSFYKYNEQRPIKWRVNGVNKMELLSEGNYTIIPPSLHADTGQQYRWIGNSLDSSLRDLPSVDFHAIRDELNEIMGMPKVERAQVFYEDYRYKSSDVTKEKLLTALSYIDPDIDYPDWVVVGMALQSYLGDRGFMYWDSWSSRGSKYDGSKALQRKWYSFSRDGGITIASLFYLASQGGFRFSSEETRDISVSVDAQELVRSAGKGKTKIKNISFDKYQMPITAPGLVGDLAHWMNSTAIYETPVLNLGASLAAIGTLMGHVFRSDTNIRTNLIIAALAPSGAGKEHARTCVDTYLSTIGARDYLGGRPKSDSAILSSLGEHPIRLYMPDELGRLLKTLTDPKALGHQRAIITLWMEIYSCANKVFYGSEYANRKDNPRFDIECPHICIYGTSVPSHFYEALTPETIQDGFLARLLMFKEETFTIEPRDVDVTAPPPDTIIDQGMEIIAMRSNEALIVPMTPEAKRSSRAFQKEMRETAKLNQEGDTRLDSLYNRAYENAIKLSMCAAEDGQINEYVFDWSRQAVLASISYAIDSIAKYVSGTDFEADYKKLLNVVRLSGGVMTERDLLKKSKWLTPQRRREIVNTAIAAEELIPGFPRGARIKKERFLALPEQAIALFE